MSWTLDDKLWLRDFLPHQLQNPPDEFKNDSVGAKRVRVMTFGYNANIFTEAPKKDTFSIGQELLAAVKAWRLGKAVRIGPIATSMSR